MNTQFIKGEQLNHNKYHLLQKIELLRLNKIFLQTITSKLLKMKRKSDADKYSLTKNSSHNNSQFEFIGRDSKRNYTSFKLQPDQAQELNSSTIKENQFRKSQTIVARLVNDVVNNLGNDIQKIEMKKMIKSVIQMTNFMTVELYKMQHPQKSNNQTCPQHEQQPDRNITDPIGGFYKQSFIKKHKKHHSRDMSLIMQKESQKILPSQHSTNIKKLPPLMRQLSEQKLQNKFFIPLEDNFEMMSKKSCYDIEQLVRERLLKQIENRKFKEKIEAISAGVDNNENVQKKNSKSTYETGQKVSQAKEDCNFDYDGNKILIFGHSKSKSNLKILKPLYKITKQKPQQKPSKLQKKFHERLSFVPRGSRNYLQFNSKTITDFGDTNYATALKEKLESELRKTEIKFVEKQFFGKQKEKRESLVS